MTRWANFLDCIRTIALRSKLRIDWDSKRWT